MSRIRHTPFTVNVHELMHQPGQQRLQTLELTLAEPFGAGVMIVPEGAKLRVELNLESVHEGILASGEVDTVATGHCVRCLRELKEPVQVEFQELFAYSGNEEGFEHSIQDNHVDLEPVLRDEVVLSLPFQPVCAGQCQELEAGDGVTVVLAGQDAPERIDPRWAALADLVEPGREDGTDVTGK